MKFKSFLGGEMATQVMSSQVENTLGDHGIDMVCVFEQRGGSAKTQTTTQVMFMQVKQVFDLISSDMLREAIEPCRGAESQPTPESLDQGHSAHKPFQSLALSGKVFSQLVCRLVKRYQHSKSLPPYVIALAWAQRRQGMFKRLREILRFKLSIVTLPAGNVVIPCLRQWEIPRSQIERFMALQLSEEDPHPTPHTA